jgi:Ca-activated chloride channel family protein
VLLAARPVVDRLSQFRSPTAACRRFANPAAAQSVVSSRPSALRHLPMALLIVALVPLTIALAQPSHDVRVPAQPSGDHAPHRVSPSMLATMFRSRLVTVARRTA